MAQTQADRKAAAKKAAATRERNRQRAKSEEAGVEGRGDAPVQRGVGERGAGQARRWWEA